MTSGMMIGRRNGRDQFGAGRGRPHAKRNGGAAAAIAASTAKAKLAGLWREKVAQTDPSGENAPPYIISDHVMSEEEWIRERSGEAALDLTIQGRAELLRHQRSAPTDRRNGVEWRDDRRAKAPVT